MDGGGMKTRLNRKTWTHLKRRSPESKLTAGKGDIYQTVARLSDQTQLINKQLRGANLKILLIFMIEPLLMMKHPTTNCFSEHTWASTVSVLVNIKTAKVKQEKDDGRVQTCPVSLQINTLPRMSESRCPFRCHLPNFKGSTQRKKKKIGMRASPLKLWCIQSPSTNGLMSSAESPSGGVMSPKPTSSNRNYINWHLEWLQERFDVASLHLWTVSTVM